MSPERPRNAGIGAALRQARIERGMSVAELQARTKVRAQYLVALEEERFVDLPPYPFTRGFLQAAAQELGLDPEPLVRRLATLMAPTGEPSVESWRRLDTAVIPAVPPSRLRRLALTAGVIAAVAVVILAGFFAQQLRQLGEPAQGPPAARPTGHGPGVAAVEPSTAPGSPVQAIQAPAGAPSQAAPGAAAPGPAGGVRLELQSTGRSWLLVVVDEVPVFEGFVASGDARQWEGKTAIRVRVGNAGVVALVVDGQTFKPLGRPGEVIDRTFSRHETR
jgi:transcriptional regulator with XRE-family HTH domain